MDNLLQDTTPDTKGVIEVIENPELPEKVAKIKLSDEISVSPEFRDEYDTWLKDKFGEQRVVYMIDGKIAIHPENMEILKQTS